jgi:hypothetical protein
VIGIKFYVARRSWTERDRRVCDRIEKILREMELLLYSEISTAGNCIYVIGAEEVL